MSIRCDIYDPKLYQIWFAAAPYSAAGKPAKTLRQWAAEEGADVVYNLALFNMTGEGSDRYGVIKGRTLQYLKAKGRDCGYGGTPERLVLDASNAVSGWKLAVKDGKVNGNLSSESRRSRNMCGKLADGRYIHVQTSASHTELEVAQYVRDRYDVELLLVQDAGGSTGMYRAADGYLFAPEKEGADGRPVCSVVCIKRKNRTAVPKEENKMSKKVFIGVGHGDSDSGAVGYIVEKEANLVMALACRDYLTAHGVEVRMSRTKDEEDPINEEVRECNAYNPDLAIDVHNNSGGGDGFEVFHTIHGGTGKMLAQNIEKQLIKIGQNSRGCKTRRGQRGDYYAFVRDTKCPAVICEGVFVDNRADAAQADTKAKQQAFGIAYAKGILDTLGIKYDTSTAKPTEPETDAETQAAITKVQQAAGLSGKTMQYLLDYEYGVELVKKLAKAMQK